MKKSLFILPIAALLALSACGQTTDDDNHSSDTHATTQTSGDSSSSTSSGSGSSSSDSSSSSSSGSSSSSQGEDVTVTVSPSSITLDVYGDSEADLTATINPSNLGYEVKWRSTNSSIVSVTQQGHIKGLYKSSGYELVYAFIDANNNNTWDTNEVRGTCQVTVLDSTPDNPYVTNVSIQWTGDHSMYFNDEKTVSTYVTGHDGDTDYSRKVTYSTDHPEILELTEVETGAKEASKVTVKGIGHGTAKLIATSVDNDSSGNKITKEIEIEVLKDVASVASVESAPNKIAKGSSINPNSVILNVLMSDGTYETRVADFVNGYDSSVVSTHVEVTAGLYGKGTATFYVDVYDGHETTYQFVNSNYEDNADASLSMFEKVSGTTGYESYRGVQTTSSNKTSSAHTKESINGMNAISVTYSTNKSTGTITVKVGESIVGTININGGTIANYKEDIQLSSQMSGVVSFVVNNTGSNSIWVKSLSIVTEHSLDGIAVLTNGKTSYNTGESFDLDDFVIVPNYTDGKGDGSEAIDHSSLTINPDRPLTPSDKKVTISDGVSSVDVDITVSDIMPISIDGCLYDNIERTNAMLEPMNLAIQHHSLDLWHDLTVLPANATNKNIELTTDAPSGIVNFVEEEGKVELTFPSEEMTIHLTFSCVADSSISKTFTVNFYDQTKPVLQEVVVDNYDAGSIVATQYEGAAFNFAGLSFEAHYNNGGDSVAVGGAAIVWATLEEGVTPHGTYTDSNGTTVNVYARYNSTELYTILVNNLTITFSGSLTKDTYELADSWSVTGITVTGEYDSGVAYTGTFNLSFDPATPSAMGVGPGTLTITATAEDGTSESETYSVTVNGNTYQNSTGLAQGSYIITNADESLYLSSVGSGAGSLTSNSDDALVLDFTLVDDDTWQIKAGEKYLAIGSDSKTLRLNNDAATLSIGWANESLGSRKIYNSSSNRAMAWNGTTDIRTYSLSNTTYNFNMYLKTNKSVSSIYSISGNTTAKLNAEWSTSNITVSGYFEDEITPKDITSLCDLTFDPATATSEDITSVNVTATLKTDSSITLTKPITASVNTSATWQIASSISVGMTVVIVNTANSKVLTSVSTIGEAGTFDDTATNQTLELRVVAGNQANTFAFKTTSNKYIAANSAKELRLVDSLNDYASWTVSFDGSSNAIITSCASASSIGRLQYNSNSPRFCTYTSNQSSVQFYTK